MIVETVIHYSKKDLAKKCWGCKFLEMYSDFDGKCVCMENKIKFRDRSITDKSCVFKKDGDASG